MECAGSDLCPSVQYPGPQNDVILRRVYCAEESMHFWGTQYIDRSPRCAQGQDDIASMNT
jgi:hypothetical protein